MPQEFDAYHRWLGIPPEQQPADHYRLLGLVRFEKDVEVIRDAAERQIAHVRRYGLGKHSDLSQRMLNELAAAKATLLDPEEKSQYDAQLRLKIEASAGRPVTGPAPGRTGPSGPVDAPRALRGPTPWSRLGRWFRRMAARFSAAPQPPPLPAPNIAPPLPAGPATPRGPFAAPRGRPEPLRTEEAVWGDPFENLRRTAIASLADRAPSDEPPQPPPAPQEKAVGRKPEPVQDDRTQLCQPTARRPTPVLWILDDGQHSGQSVRMRKFPFRIGRTDGDVRIPHDPAIEDLHLEISWHEEDATPQLVIRDLGSRSGLFVRAVKARVRVGQEIRMGSGCYRLAEPCILEEISPQEGRRLALEPPEAWLGRDPRCEPVHLSSDPMVDRRHAKMRQDSDDAWSIEDNDSLNGTWLRVPQVFVRSRAEILIGEQPLVVDIPQHNSPRPLRERN